MTRWTAARHAPLSSTVSWYLLKFMCIESMMPPNLFTLCCPLLFLPFILPSIRVFYNESVLFTRWPKYWSFNFSISPSNDYSVLNSFRSDWFDLLAIQGTLKSFLQHHNSKASILWCSLKLGLFQINYSPNKYLKSTYSSWYMLFFLTNYKWHIRILSVYQSDSLVMLPCCWFSLAFLLYKITLK